MIKRILYYISFVWDMFLIDRSLKRIQNGKVVIRDGKKMWVVKTKRGDTILYNPVTERIPDDN